MKDTHKMRTPKTHNSAIKTGQKKNKLIPRVVTGIVVIGLIAAAGYGILFVSSLFSITTKLTSMESDSHQKEETSHAYQVPQPAEPPPEPVQKSVAPKEVAVAKPAPVKVEPAEEVEEDADVAEPEEEVVLDENGLVDERDKIMAMEREIALLRAALPNNMMVPAEKTDSEIEALLADAEEQHALQDLIDKGTATAEDRERYFELLANQYEDERELITYCQQLMANGDERGDSPSTVCKEVARDSDQRLEEIDASLDDLRQKLL